MEDQYDNIVLLLDEREANQCISTPDTATLIQICAVPSTLLNTDIDININDGLSLVNRLSFKEGLVLYFTSE